MTDRRPDGSADPLRELWTTEEPPREIRLDDLRAAAARVRQRMLWVVASEALLTVVLIGLTILALRGELPLSDAAHLWLAVAWTTWALAVVFALWNRHGAWRAHGETARDFLVLSEKRARGRVRVAAFVFVLTTALAIAFTVLGWMGWIGAAVFALYFGWALSYGRRARRNLADARRIVAEFDEAGERL